MLMINRRLGESIRIGEDTFLTVTRFNGNQVSLGFDAPTSVIIQRYEIYKRILAEKKVELDNLLNRRKA
jgi:carbon storage regulator